MDWRMKMKTYLRLNFLYQFLSVFTGLISLFLVGSHTAWASVYIPELLKGRPFVITSDEGSWIAVSLSFGAVLGSVLSTLANDCGRKPIILMTSIPYLLSPLLLALTKSFGFFCAARVVAGIAAGTTLSVTPLYLSEVAHEKIRGALGTCLELAMIAGFLFVNCVGEHLGDFLICLGLIGSVVIFAGIFVLLPESPYFLMMNGKYNKARSSLTKLHGRDAVKQYYILKGVVEARVDNKGTLADIFKIQSNRRALGILCVVLSGKQLSAEGAVDAYGRTIFTMICDQISPTLIATIYYLSKLLITIVTCFVTDKVGRRQTLLVLFFCAAICSLILGIHLYVKQHYAIYYDQTSDYVAVATLTLLGVCHCAISSLPMIMLNDLFPMNIKHHVTVFFGIYSFTSLCLTIKFFHFTSTTFGPEVSFFSYAASGFLHYILIYICVLETAGKTTKEIQDELSDET